MQFQTPSRVGRDLSAGETTAPGFDFTLHMRRLCVDVAGRLSEFRHVDMSRVAVCFVQTRKRARHGLWATLTPMRFPGGTLYERRGGGVYTCQRLFDAGGREMLYILNFYLPRFTNIGFRDKLVTVFHELWHISPDFDGDLRRHPGRCYAHTRSQGDYDRRMGEFVDQWLALSPPGELYRFLRLRYWQLQRRYGRVRGTTVAHPRLIPLISIDS